jgi:hypothetical protein
MTSSLFPQEATDSQPFRIGATALPYSHGQTTDFIDLWLLAIAWFHATRKYVRKALAAGLLFSTEGIARNNGAAQRHDQSVQVSEGEQPSAALPPLAVSVWHDLDEFRSVS